MALVGVGITERGGRDLERRLNKRAETLAVEYGRRIERATLETERNLQAVGMTGRSTRHPWWGKVGPDPSTHQIAVRTGNTRASVTSRTYRIGNTFVGVVGSPMAHLKLLEEGGEIHGSPMLRIPLAPAQTPAGVDRNLGRSVRGLDFFVWPSRRQRRGRLAGRQPHLARVEGGRLRLYYLLKKSVRIRARHVFRATADRMRKRVQSIVNAPISIFRAGD